MGPEKFTAGLPWGWWLRASGAQLEDEQGRKWNSVRDAYWRGHLGFLSDPVAEEQQELLLRALMAIDSRGASSVESKSDLFGSDFLFWRFYQSWLSSIGLLNTTEQWQLFRSHLSPEGRSVKLMLQATRQPEWEVMPMREVVEAVIAATRGSDADKREQVLIAFEREVGFRRHTFARERVGRSYLVTLTGIATEARMPTRRVTWSQSFSDAPARDDLFAWLANRVDCWDAWGSLAYQKGADAFTNHLLTLVIEAGGLAS
jgi:hypothetical protein